MLDQSGQFESVFPAFIVTNPLLCGGSDAWGRWKEVGRALKTSWPLRSTDLRCLLTGHVIVHFHNIIIQWFCGVVLKQLTCLYYSEHRIIQITLSRKLMTYILYAPVYRACNAAVGGATNHSFFLSLKVEPGHCDTMPWMSLTDTFNSYPANTQPSTTVSKRHTERSTKQWQ